MITLTYRGMNEFDKEINSQLSEDFVVLNTGRLVIFIAVGVLSRYSFNY
jgi:hypothetical protein